MSLNVKEEDRAKKLVRLKQIIGAVFVFTYTDYRFFKICFVLKSINDFVFLFFCGNKDQPNESK